MSYSRYVIGIAAAVLFIAAVGVALTAEDSSASYDQLLQEEAKVFDNNQTQMMGSNGPTPSVPEQRAVEMDKKTYSFENTPKSEPAKIFDDMKQKNIMSQLNSMKNTLYKPDQKKDDQKLNDQNLVKETPVETNVETLKEVVEYLEENDADEDTIELIKSFIEYITVMNLVETSYYDSRSNKDFDEDADENAEDVVIVDDDSSDETPISFDYNTEHIDNHQNALVKTTVDSVYWTQSFRQIVTADI